MKLSQSLLQNVLLASNVLAAPAILGQRSPNSQDGILAPASSFPRFVASAEKFQTKMDIAETEDGPVASNTTQISGNWAGVAFNVAPTGTTYYSIEGIFNIPKPQPPVKGPGRWSGAAWAGIFGPQALLQSGVTWVVSVDKTGRTSYEYSGWYEWLPLGSVIFDNFTIRAGDEIQVKCEAQSTSTGTCSLHNFGTRVKVSADLKAPNVNATLEAAQGAAWIVEDFSSGGLVPFADFGHVNFTNCFALVGDDFADGSEQNVPVTWETGSKIGISINGTVVTDVNFDNYPTAFSVDYVPKVGK